VAVGRVFSFQACAQRSFTTSRIPSKANYDRATKLSIPRYLNARPWKKAAELDQDGVPIVPFDDTPHDLTNRPKRHEPKWHRNTTANMKEFNTYELLTTPKTDKGLLSLRKPPTPKIKGIVPESRNAMTVELLLKKIGRDCVQHLKHFNSWDALFQARGPDMKRLEIPLKDRKYILAWLERYRQGVDPYFMPLHSKSHKNKSLEWRHKLITQKAKRIELGLE
jgi:hypothetical protein